MKYKIFYKSILANNATKGFIILSSIFTACTNVSNVNNVKTTEAKFEEPKVIIGNGEGSFCYYNSQIDSHRDFLMENRITVFPMIPGYSANGGMFNSLNNEIASQYRYNVPGAYISARFDKKPIENSSIPEQARFVNSEFEKFKEKTNTLLSDIYNGDQSFYDKCNVCPIGYSQGGHVVAEWVPELIENEIEAQIKAGSERRLVGLKFPAKIEDTVNLTTKFSFNNTGLAGCDQLKIANYLPIGSLPYAGGLLGMRHAESQRRLEAVAPYLNSSNTRFFGSLDANEDERMTTLREFGVPSKPLSKIISKYYLAEGGDGCFSRNDQYIPELIEDKEIPFIKLKGGHNYGVINDNAKIVAEELTTWVTARA